MIDLIHGVNAVIEAGSWLLIGSAMVLGLLVLAGGGLIGFGLACVVASLRRIASDRRALARNDAERARLIDAL